MNQVTLEAVMSRLDAMQGQLASIAERQRKQEELVDELVMPIAKDALKSLTADFAEFEKKGYFAFGRELVRVGQRIMESYTPEDVRALGDSITTILDTVKAVTQPQVLAIAAEASDAVHRADQTEPLGLVGLVRATSNHDVGRGLAVMLEVLKKVGKGAAAVQQSKSQRDKVNALLAPKRRPNRALGIERPASPRPAAKALPANGTPSAAPAPVVLDGVAFNPDGHLADSAQWNPTLGETIAAAQGVALTADHWKVIDFARQDYAEKKAAPNIRRITQGMNVDTRSIYALFPKAPGRTIAKIAGLPKPAGCL
ncbi:MAG: TusE/DsrC/DsvC family sulfur relay protein [Myxococcaceae bacterium]